MPKTFANGMHELVHDQADIEELARAVTADMPDAFVAERMKVAMKRCGGTMHPRLVLAALSRDAASS